MNKKNKFSLIGLSLLFIIGFSTSGMAYFDPGSGGGSLLPTPELYQPTSPDYDGIIILEWSEVSGADYKIYRWNSQTGIYKLIAATTNRARTYIDAIPNGTWAYKVKAYNPDTGQQSLCSNPKSVVVELPAPKPLIGSTQRFFPQELDAKLGFTILSIDTYYTPTIEFSLINTMDPDKTIDIKIYVDNSEIYNEMGIILTKNDLYPFIIDANELTTPLTHQIVIELSHGQNIRLEDLFINNLWYIENTLDNNKRYTPLQNCIYNDLPDDPVVDLEVFVPYTEPDGEVNDYLATFGTSLLVNIDPDTYDFTRRAGVLLEICTYYIHGVSLQWRVLCPDGTYMDNQNLGIFCDISTSYEGTDFYEQVNHVLKQISNIINLINFPEYIEDPLNWAIKFLTFMNPDDPVISKERIDNDKFVASWHAGGFLAIPNPTLESLSMYTGFTIQLPNPKILGSYQMEITWMIDIDLLVYLSGYPAATSHEDAYEVSSTYYLNFEYV